MKFVSIDIETTGLTPEKCQILSVGLAIEDTNNILPLNEIPSLHIAILRDEICGSPFAISMNMGLIMNINSYMSYEATRTSLEQDTEFMREDEVTLRIWRFLWDNGIRPDGHEELRNYDWVVNDKHYPSPMKMKSKTYVTVAGKNFGTFDKVFLELLPRWKQLIKVRSRIIDPAVLFVDWHSDEQLPGLDLCKARAGVEGIVTHNALEDAKDVISVLRKIYGTGDFSDQNRQ